MNSIKEITLKKVTAQTVAADVKFSGSDKLYSYQARKVYVDNKGVTSILISGFKIVFEEIGNDLVIKEITQMYTTGKKKRGVSTVSEIKKEIEKIKEKETEPQPIAEPEKISVAYEPKKTVHHKEFETILMCVKNNIPVYLAGPAGSGKNHTLEQVAKEIGFDFYFTNSVQQEYKLTGFVDAGGVYHETEFYRAFKNGGLFFLDEMDASIPEVLVLLNAAIANGYFEFPNGKITAHENFRVVAAGNTVGSGADENYTGRMVLDQATLDRFVIINFDYDPDIELHLAKGNGDLVEFIHSIREYAESNGIRATFSYRCISMVVKLEEAGMSLEKIMLIAVVKGLDKDTINTLKASADIFNRYGKALANVA